MNQQSNVRHARQKLVETIINPLDLAVLRIELLITKMAGLSKVQPAYKVRSQARFTSKTSLPSA